MVLPNGFLLPPFWSAMRYKTGQTIWWAPVYFKWDVPRFVDVIRTYRCGSALLSNHQTVDCEGVAQWDNGTLLGRVYENRPECTV
jgi:hypothetical protein